MYFGLYIYSVSQKWVHPSHFCRYLSIFLHGTTLTKWHFDTMKSSLCAAYITELIYFPLQIPQNITIKTKSLSTKVSTPLRNYTPKCPNCVVCHFPSKMSCDSLVLLGPCVTRLMCIGSRCVQICSAALTFSHTGHWKFQHGTSWQRTLWGS